MSTEDPLYDVHPLERGVPPAWASAWGDSECGPWVAIEVGDVEYVLQWIPAGTFTMGSPEGEPGRFASEGPQHEVTITRGFWMGATPVTQALYEAVVGANPSAFKDPERPVETVSWDDAQAFLRVLEEKQPGLRMRLPTEAQWEYACRAGTTEATYAGPMEILGENDAPILDAIAWYGGNRGNDNDLEEHADSKGWPEKQHAHTKVGTRQAGTRRCNPWGLYDMLGNVWEWCQDWHRPYGGAAVIDPIGPHEGSLRVLRGGSWNDPARNVRAACRDARGPSRRNSFTGFRLSRGHGAPSQPSKQGPEGPGRRGADREGRAGKLPSPARRSR